MKIQGKDMQRHQRNMKIEHATRITSSHLTGLGVVVPRKLSTIRDWLVVFNGHSLPEASLVQMD